MKRFKMKGYTSIEAGGRTFTTVHNIQELNDAEIVAFDFYIKNGILVEDVFVPEPVTVVENIVEPAVVELVATPEEIPTVEVKQRRKK